MSQKYNKEKKLRTHIDFDDGDDGDGGGGDYPVSFITKHQVVKLCLIVLA